MLPSPLLAWLSLLRELPKLVRQHGKQETVDEAAVGKYRRTQYAFLHKAKPPVKANRGLVGDIDLEKNPMQSQSAKGKAQQQPGGFVSETFTARRVISKVNPILRMTRSPVDAAEAECSDRLVPFTLGDQEDALRRQ